MAGHGNQEGSRWEIPLDRWTPIKETLRDRIVRSARLGVPIAYSNLVSGLPFDGPHSHAFAEMLGELCVEAMDRGEPMITAIVVYIDGEMKGEAAPSFARFAQQLGRLAPEADADGRRIFAAQEADRVYDFFRRRR